MYFEYGLFSFRNDLDLANTFVMSESGEPGIENDAIQFYSTAGTVVRL